MTISASKTGQKALMEHACVLAAANRCAICGSLEASHVVTVDRCRYVRCTGCSVTRMEVYPTEEEHAKAYESDYMNNRFNGLGHHIHFTPGYRSTYFREKDLTFSDIDMDLEHYRGKRLLDVGCANGQFLEYARKFGIIAEGIDVSKEMVAVGAENGLDCRSGEITEVEGAYDIITLWDVIEHLRDPLQAVNKAFDILNPGGEIIIQTPCTGIISDLFREKWLYYLPVQHIHLFSCDSLYELLESAGFTVFGHVRFGSNNPKGSIPDVNKMVMDTIAKRMDIGDTIVVRAGKV